MYKIFQVLTSENVVQLKGYSPTCDHTFNSSFYKVINKTRYGTAKIQSVINDKIYSIGIWEIGEKELEIKLIK